jgi:hypothetical protein
MRDWLVMVKMGADGEEREEGGFDVGNGGELKLRLTDWSCWAAAKGLVGALGPGRPGARFKQENERLNECAESECSANGASPSAFF